MKNRTKNDNPFKLLVICVTFSAFLFGFSSSAFSSGELRVGWDTTEMVQSFNDFEAWHYDTMGCMFWQLLYDQMWLTEPAPAYDIKPWAITGFETSDHKTWRFTMREGMKFHDGKPVTIEDIAFTMEHLPNSSPTWAFNDSITEKDAIIIIDNKTVEFELQLKLGNKYAPFYFFPIFPKHLWKRHKFDMENYENRDAIGSGPFKLKEFKAGQHMVFEKFEDYWEKSHRADKVVFKSFGSSDAKNMALKRGEIDMIGYYGISPLSINSFKNNSEIEMIQSPGLALVSLTFNLHPEGPIKDLNVRKAIVHGIDKESIIKMVYHGYATIHDSLIYPELPEYNPDLPKYDFNPELSRTILKDAGYIDTDDNGFRNDPKTGKDLRFKFLISTDSPENVKLAVMAREQLKNIGIQIEIKSLDMDTYYDLLYYPQGNAFDIAISMHESGPYADWIWEYMRSAESGGAGWNTAYYMNPEMDELIMANYAESDMEKKKEICFRMQQILAEDLPHYVICRPDIIEPVRTDKLQGYVTNFMGGVSSWINPFSYINVHAKE